MLADVSRPLGLNAAEARLLGPVGDNAVFLLPYEHAVARVSLVGARSRVERELRVARWLAEHKIHAVRPRTQIEQPIVHDGHVVTLWDEIPDPTQATTAEMGAALRRLHRLPWPPEGLIPPIDPFARQHEHIDEATGLADDEREFLAARLAELKSAYSELRFALPQGVVHGDAHRKNVVRDATGRVALLDLERFGTGPREWDLIVPAVYQRVGWYDEAAYRDFTDAYGYDIRGWDGYPVMAAIRQLRMTAWLASRTGREPRLVTEAHRRIQSLRDPSVPGRWTPGT